MRNAVGRIESTVVFGGTSDIAVATLEALIARGTRRVALAGRDRARLDVRADALRASGADVTVHHFDALDFGSHTTLVESIWEQHGDVDLVLIAFGTLGDPNIDEHDPGAAVDVIGTGFTGAASVGVAVAERMRAQGHGTIVVLSSVAGERVRRANFVYGSAKAGLDGFFLGLGEALRGTGVHVTVVRPGFVHTKMTKGMTAAPLAVGPERVAADIVRGLERGSELVWSPPAMRAVMSVLRHIPRALFRRLPI